MHVTVISPETCIFDGEADAVVAPAYDPAELYGVVPGEHLASMGVTREHQRHSVLRGLQRGPGGL